MSRGQRQYGSGYGRATAEKPDLRTYLDLYGVDYRETPGWQTTHCPNPDHPDTSSSCGLNLSEGVMKCHVCDFSGDVYSLIMIVTGFGFKEAKALAASARSADQDGVGGGDSSLRGGVPGQPRRGVRAGGSATRPRYRRSSPDRLRRSRDGHAGA